MQSIYFIIFYICNVIVTTISETSIDSDNVDNEAIINLSDLTVLKTINSSVHDKASDKILSVTKRTTASQSTDTSTEPHHSKLNVPKISSQLYSRGKMDECWKNAECEPLEDNVCLGVKLPYSHTSLAISKLPSQRAAREALDNLKALKNLPHCWSVVQPFLCAVLFPHCNDSLVQLPSRELCAITRGPCRLFEQESGWPEFLKCKEEFQPKCKMTSRDLPFNTTGECLPPLVNTSNEDLWFNGIRGCGVQCSDPLFTAEEHKDLRWFVAMLGGICLACSGFTVLTYLVDWRYASRYPALIIFYINGCFLVTSIGFMVQFYGSVRERVTCYPDGTLRNSEPSSGGNLSCVVVFVCVYYFMIAAGMWFIILGYAWHKSFKSLAAGQCQQNLERKAAYFHLISWSIPLIFTIGVIASAEVKADSAVGICFLSSSPSVRIGALLAPIALVIFIGSVFLVGGLKTLVKMKLECSNIISDHANKKIVETIIRLGIFIVVIIAFFIITLYFHVYVFINQNSWKDSLRAYILCVSGIKYDGSKCSMVHRPSINLFKLNLMALFGSGIIMASWCWTTNTVESWQRFIRRVAGVGVEEPVRMTKHKVIAQAFAKRKDLNKSGRLSISLRPFHSDPVGLNFEMNSPSSCDVSSVWASAIPYLMNRRGAVSGSSAFIFRRNSVDSEYSISRRLSLESAVNSRRGLRRHSLDSQMSFHVSDVERLAAMQTVARFGGRRRRRDWFSLRKGRKTYERRNSTSDDSNMGSMILPAPSTLSTNDSLFTTMMKRLNLSGDESFSCAKIDATQFHLATNSEDETRDDEIRGVVSSFSRKYNGFKRKGYEFKLSSKAKECNDACTQVVKASIGVQTSLESLILSHPLTQDKSCQVSTPLLERTKNHTSSSSPSGSITSLGGSGKIKETSFISGRNARNNRERARRSLSPLSIKSYKRISSSNHKKLRKKRCASENEKNNCILNLEGVL